MPLDAKTISDLSNTNIRFCYPLSDNTHRFKFVYVFVKIPKLLSLSLWQLYLMIIKVMLKRVIKT